MATLKITIHYDPANYSERRVARAKELLERMADWLDDSIPDVGPDEDYEWDMSEIDEDVLLLPDPVAAAMDSDPDSLPDTVAAAHGKQ